MKRFKHWELVGYLLIFVGLAFYGYQTEYKPAYDYLQRTKAHYLETHKTLHHPGCKVTTAEAADDCMLRIMERDLKEIQERNQRNRNQRNNNQRHI